MFDNLWQTFAHLKVACENTQAEGEEGWLFSQATMRWVQVWNRHPDSLSQISRYGWMRSVSLWGELTSDNRIISALAAAICLAPFLLWNNFLRRLHDVYETAVKRANL